MHPLYLGVKQDFAPGFSEWSRLNDLHRGDLCSLGGMGGYMTGMEKTNGPPPVYLWNEDSKQKKGGYDGGRSLPVLARRCVKEQAFRQDSGRFWMLSFQLSLGNQREVIKGKG
jgi:hypothetical protein